MTTILHFADVHLDQTTEANATRAMEQILELAQREKPDLIVNAGDLAMRRGAIAPWVAHRLRKFHCDLAQFAPVVIVAGNHDMTFEAGRVGTALGAVEIFQTPLEEEIYIAERPQIWQLAGLNVVCLPYPSRQQYATIFPGAGRQETNAEMSQELGRFVRALEANDERIDHDLDTILVYHGSIAGAKPGDELTMTTEMDIILDEEAVGPFVPAILAGHIHRHQAVGCAVYAGSPAPLSFSEEQYDHGAVIWTITDQTVGWKFHEFTPAHRLITADLREKDLATAKPWEGAASDLIDAKVRVLVRLPRDAGAAAIVTALQDGFKSCGAATVHVQVERAEEQRRPEIELRAEARIDQLLKVYIARNPLPKHIDANEVEAFAAEVEGLLTPEDQAAARGANYELLRLSWSNWKSFSEGPHDLNLQNLGQLTAIEGENASGKSNAAEVEAFALWGRTPRGKVALADLIRIGERKASVVAEIEVGVHLYRVVRTISLNSRGAGSAELVVSESFATGQWQPAAKGTAAETQAWLETLVGPFELYMATRYASQGDVDRLLDMTPAELKTTLFEALGAKAFVAREAWGKGETARLSSTLAVARTKLEFVEAQLQERAGLEGMIPEAEREVATWNERFAISDVAAREWRTKLALVRAELAGDEQSQKRHEAAYDRVTRIEAVLAKMRARLSEINANAEDATHWRPFLVELNELRTKRSGLQKVLAEKAGAERELAQCQRRVEDLRREANSENTRSETTTTALTREIQVLKERSGDLEQQAAAVGMTPFGEACVEKGCSLILAAVEARGRIPGLTAEVVRGRRRVDAETDRHASALVAIGGHLEEAHDLVTIATRALERAVEAATGEEDLERRIKALEVAGHEARVQRADDGLRIRDELITQLTLAEEEEEAADAALAANPRPRIAELQQQEQEVLATLETAERTLTERAKASEVAKEQLARLRGRIEQLNVIDAARQAEVVECLAHRHAAAEFYTTAVSKNGIPLLLFERTIPTLEAHANRFLGDDAGLRLELDPDRELQSGERRSDVVLRYSNGFGSHPMSAASGFERVALGYALRASLAQVQAEAHGLKVSHWIADEGWGAFDEKNLLLGQQMLRRLAEEFQRVIFISHVGAIREVADSAVRVSINGANGSTLEVVR